VRRLKQRFGKAILSDEIMKDMLCVSIEKSYNYEVLLFLRDDSEMQFNFLTTLCGMHYPEKDELGVVYHLHNFIDNHRIRIKITTAVSDAVLHSVTAIWPTANWMERETYDFYGIVFQGHPNLKRILNVDEMTDFPMRKDFPLEDQTREDKDNTMFGRK
jgi:NADH-quinone oxidoreductase subunit C